MTASRPDNEAIFHAARDIPDPDRRREYVREACGGDEARIVHVEALLAAADGPDSLLDRPAAGTPVATIDQPTTESPGTVIGPYKLLQEIGEGGMGTVFMAEQTRPVQRKVALKLIKAGMDSKQIIARFDAERQALAMMDHVNIARVLDAGTTESGRPYFVMELVHGIPITKYCDDNRLTPRERLELFVPVCQAIQHAHQKGIIHRDIKPSNVMITLYDGKPVPKIIDFGVAKATEQKLTERTLFTQYGTMVGTFEYMSPEQAEMSALGVDTRSDIYSLGVLLYELLTGSTPLSHKRLKEAAYGEILRMIREEEAPKPSTRLSDSGEALASISANRHMEPAKLTKLVRGELDWIVMKTLEKDRNRRYETANGFAMDLQRYLADEPVEACPPSARYRLSKFARKYKKALATAAGFAVLLLAVAVLSTLLAVWAKSAEGEATSQRIASDAAKQEALEAKADADKKREELRRSLYASNMNLIQTAWEANNIDRGRELFNDPLFREAGKADLRGFEWHYWKRRYDTGFRSVSLPGDSEYSVFHPDGTRIAVFSEQADLPAKKVTDIRVCDAVTGQVLWQTRLAETVRNSGAVSMPAFAGRRVAYPALDSSGKEKTFVWDIKTGERVALTSDEGSLTYLAFNSDGGKLAGLRTGTPGGEDCAVVVWDVENGKELFHVTKLTGMGWDLQFSSDGSRLGAALGAHSTKHAGGVRVWDAATGKELLTVPRGSHDSTGLALAPDGTRLAADSPAADGSVTLWDTATRKELLTLPPQSRTVRVLAFSADGTRLAVGGWDGLIAVWDFGPKARAAAPRLMRLLKGHTSGVVRLTFSADGRSLYSIPLRGSPRAWTLEDEDSRLVLPTQGSGNRGQEALSFSPDGTRIGIAVQRPEATEITMWNITGKELWRRRVAQAAHPLRSIVFTGFSPDGKRFAVLAVVSGGPLQPTESRLTIFDVDTGKESLVLPQTSAIFFAFSPDSRSIATSCNLSGFVGAGHPSAVIVWDADMGKELLKLPLTGHVPLALAFAPDGRSLAAVVGNYASKDEDSKVRVWDATTGQLLQTLGNFKGPVGALAFSPDGRSLALVPGAGFHYAVDGGVWDVASGKKRFSLGDTYAERADAAFSPDGRRIVTNGPSVRAESWLRICDADNGRELLTLMGHEGPIIAFALSPDGHRVFSASDLPGGKGTEIRVWDATPLPDKGIMKDGNR